MILAVFCLSWVAASVWKHIWSKTEEKLRVADRLCRALGLN